MNKVFIVFLQFDCCKTFEVVRVFSSEDLARNYLKSVGFYDDDYDHRVSGDYWIVEKPVEA